MSVPGRESQTSLSFDSTHWTTTPFSRIPALQVAIPAASLGGSESKGDTSAQTRHIYPHEQNGNSAVENQLHIVWKSPIYAGPRWLTPLCGQEQRSELWTGNQMGLDIGCYGGCTSCPAENCAQYTSVNVSSKVKQASQTG